MSRAFSLRALQKSDFSLLEWIIRETWRFDAFCPPRTARQLASAYWDASLAGHTFAQVALINGHPAGVILARCKKDTPDVPSGLRLARAAATAALAREGLEALSVFARITRINRTLLQRSGQHYDAEITFFAVAQSARGIGIGQALYDSALAYFAQAGAASFFLYTDTSCNFGFYEHQGLERRCEESQVFSFDSGKMEIFFYLYDNLCHCAQPCLKSARKSFLLGRRPVLELLCRRKISETENGKPTGRL